MKSTDLTTKACKRRWFSCVYEYFHVCVCVRLCSSNAIYCQHVYFSDTKTFLFWISVWYTSQTQKPFFFEYLYGTDLISLKVSNFQGNYRDLVITIATQQFWNAMACRLLKLRDPDGNRVPAQVCGVLQGLFFCLNRRASHHTAPPTIIPKVLNFTGQKNVQNRSTDIKLSTLFC